jgi:hypothetical protein
MDKPKAYIWKGELFWASEYELIREEGDDAQPLYTEAPKREWVGLTDDEIWDCYTSQGKQFYLAIEAKLKEKNT